MADLLNSTRFKSPATAASSFNITIPATAANSKLVCISGGGAVVTAKLGVGGTNFTKRTVSLFNLEVAAQDIVDAAGGTTTIQITLNGAQNVDGYIYEFASGTLGNFIAGANQGGNSVALDADWQIGTQSITTSGASVIFAMFTVPDTNSDPARKFFGFEPLGKQYTNEYINTDPTKDTYRSMIGVSDQASAGTFSAKSSRVVAGAHQNVIWAYENLAPGTPTYANPYPNAIAAENSLPGSRSTVWHGATTNTNIAGYTDAMSYSPGDTVNFKVDSNNTGFNVEIFRHGYYNYNSFGGKRKATVAGSPAVQSAPSIDSYGGTVCSWSTTASWAIPSDATPGIYIYNMRRTDNSNFVAQGIFVVKSPVPGSQGNKVMLATSEFTWQAYNVWGARTDNGTGYTSYTGRSLYGQAPGVTIGTRAFAVSFDRPMGTIGANKSSYYWESEGGLVSFLEGNGYDMAYFASTDIEKNSVIPSRFKVAVSSGHSEYWTDNLRDAYEDARAAGTNLMFMSSNTSLWRVRFDGGDTNKRTMICYKDSHDITGYDNTTKYDPVSYTGTWRDSRTNVGGVNNTFQRPEPALGGQWFIGNGPFNDRIAVTNTHGSSPVWRNTRVATGGTITHRGSVATSNNSAATTINYTQPAGTQVGDLVVAALVFNSNPGIMSDNNMRLVRQTIDGTSQYTYIFIGYANTAGAVGGNFTWNASVVASIAVSVYGGAVWWDTDAAIKVDNGGTTVHTTRSITNAAADMWAVCAFADTTVSGSTKTTSWTAGSGLTSRVTANNAGGAGPWNSIALMDTNGVVTQGAHQYSATAEFANTNAAAGIIYISPGTTLYAGTVGYEWDYVKPDEPTTPYNLVMLSQQPLALASQASNYNGDSYARTSIHKYGISLFRDDTSSALVFNTGTWRYQWGISRFRAGNHDIDNGIDVAMQQATINMLKDMGVTYGALLDTIANVDATALVDPGSAASAAAYGLTIPQPTAYQNIFTPSTLPGTSSSNGNDGTDYTFGTVFSSSANGQIHGIKWYFPDYLPNDHVIGLLYSWTNNTAGVELARTTFYNTQSGWNQATFSSPINITAGTKYVAAVWTVDRYVTSLGQFSSGAVTNGDLTAPQDTVGTHNGQAVSGIGSPSYPNASFGNGYLADVLYTAGGGVLTFEGWGMPIN